MKPGYWKLKVAVGTGNTGNWHFSQPILDIPTTLISLVRDEVTNPKGSLSHDRFLTAFICLSHVCLVFVPQMAPAEGT
jgi:hypothetical protein